MLNTGANWVLSYTHWILRGEGGFGFPAVFLFGASLTVGLAAVPSVLLIRSSWATILVLRFTWQDSASRYPRFLSTSRKTVTDAFYVWFLGETIYIYISIYIYSKRLQWHRAVLRITAFCWSCSRAGHIAAQQTGSASRRSSAQLCHLKGGEDVEAQNRAGCNSPRCRQPSGADLRALPMQSIVIVTGQIGRGERPFFPQRPGARLPRTSVLLRRN